MEFRLPEPPRRADTVLPMVNLVFLLLIFFLMAATLSPPAPVRLTPPAAEGAEAAAAGPLGLYLDAGGILFFEGAEGEAALATLAARLDTEPAPVALHADRAAPARRLAEVLGAARAAGAGPVWLVVEPAQ